jgi:hypothetical protein
MNRDRSHTGIGKMLTESLGDIGQPNWVPRTSPTMEMHSALAVAICPSAWRQLGFELFNSSAQHEFVGLLRADRVPCSSRSNVHPAGVAPCRPPWWFCRPRRSTPGSLVSCFSEPAPRDVRCASSASKDTLSLDVAGSTAPVPEYLSERGVSLEG